MSRSARLFAAFSLMASAALVFWLGCDTGQPQLIYGPNVSGNTPPALTILTPNSTTNLNQGERLAIAWDDSDIDSAALITFTLVNIETGAERVLVANIEENNALDEISVGTSLVPQASYWLRGDITDGVQSFSTYALLEGSTSTRAVITIGEPGTNPLSVPPRVAVLEPSFNQGVAQDDSLQIVVSPTRNVFDTTTPYDPDSDATLYVVLDEDEDPTNDNAQLTNPDGIIKLRTTAIPEGDATAQTYTINIDLATIPQRPNGEPYFIRATIIDASNEAVHAYAAGAINIVRSATDIVDVAQVGFTVAGARFQGFNPGSWLGSKMTGLGDFDADGVDDFMLVARYGNPRNFGNIGEAYLIYGLPQARYGGSINVNSVSTSVPGVILEAPPNRLANLHADPLAKPRGITDVAPIDDLTGDGRPDFIVGMPMVDGIFQGRDDDPGDDPAQQGVNIALQEELARRELNGTPDTDLDDDFRGTIDTYIDRLEPGNTFGDEPTLLLGAQVPPDEDNPADQFVIIGYPGSAILDVFTTLTIDDINDLSATLELSTTTDTLPSPEAFEVHRLLISPGENVTYAQFGADGTPGPTEETEYDGDTLDVGVNFLQGTITIDVTETIEALLNGELATDPAWILIPTAATEGTFASSENDTTELRPQLTITYNEDLPDTPNYGCYPDTYPNNVSTTPDDPGVAANPMVDSTFEACGVAVFVASENRDQDGFVDPDRLTSTVVTLELVGQEDPVLGLAPDYNFGDEAPLIGGYIEHQAGAEGSPAGDGLLRGCRLQTGWYDYVNDGLRGQAAPRLDYFGESVASMPDVDNDSGAEIIISAPRNELYLSTIEPDATVTSVRHTSATVYEGSIIVFPSADYSVSGLASDPDGNQVIPRWGTQVGQCDPDNPIARSGPFTIRGGFEIFAEDPTDYLGGARHAGDVNLDGVPDIVCGAPYNDSEAGSVNTGAAYIIYGRTPVGFVYLSKLDTPADRPPTLRIRGEMDNDRFGQVQSSGLDINGDRIDDVFIASPDVDFGGVSTDVCGDYDNNGLLDGNDLNLSRFNSCRQNSGDEVFLGDACKAYDFDNDRDIDADDRTVFDCLVGGFSGCCPVDNGFVGVVFGDIQLDGDRTISQIGTPDLPGIKFFGANAGDRAGADVVSAGDFNRDGYGDLLIAAPGVEVTDANGRQRLGVAYLIFGGTHLNGNLSFSLDQVGSPELPGIVFYSPFVAGRPNEAPIDHVGFLGDINGDGFDDIGLGMTRADFLDNSLPQAPNDPGTNPNIGRRPDDGNVYIIYGNNTGSNR